VSWWSSHGDNRTARERAAEAQRSVTSYTPEHRQAAE